MLVCVEVHTPFATHLLFDFSASQAFELCESLNAVGAVLDLHELLDNRKALPEAESKMAVLEALGEISRTTGALAFRFLSFSSPSQVFLKSFFKSFLQQYFFMSFVRLSLLKCFRSFLRSDRMKRGSLACSVFRIPCCFYLVPLPRSLGNALRCFAMLMFMLQIFSRQLAAYSVFQLAPNLR